MHFQQADCLATSWMLVTGRGPRPVIKVRFYATIYLENVFQLKVCPEGGMCALSIGLTLTTLYYHSANTVR